MKVEVLYRTGKRGSTVSLVRRSDSSMLYLRWWDGSLRDGKGDYVWQSLEHDDQELGEDQTDDAAKILRRGDTPRGQEPEALSIAELMVEYGAARHEPRRDRHGRKLPSAKSPKQIQRDRYRMGLFMEFAGPARDALSVDPDTMEAYTEWRRGQEISDTTIGHELVFIRGVYNWAISKRTASGRPLLLMNPIAGVKRIKSDDPNTPVTSDARFVRIYRHADRVDPQGLLRPLMMFVHEHGWRITAWCRLWASDIDIQPYAPEPGIVWPYGRIRKQRANDKGKRPDKWVPMTRRSRAAAIRLLRRNPTLGDTYVFPAPQAEGPWQDQHALALLHRAELSVGHPERLEFLRRMAPLVGHTVEIRHGRGCYPLAEYLERRGEMVENGLGFAAKLVAQVNDAMGTDWQASLEIEPGHGFHGLRRKWGTERKGMPLPDVAEAGDWHPMTLLQHYQKADPQTTLQVTLREGVRAVK